MTSLQSNTQARRNPALIAVGIALFGCTVLTTASADDTIVDPAWANSAWSNSAWYVGAGLGQSHATVDEARLTRALGATGDSVAFGANERDTGYKLYAGKQLNQYFAIEGGYFDLGKFGFHATTSSAGVLNGQAGFKGLDLDLVAMLPLAQRWTLYGRAGANYARTTTDFSGNRLNAVTQPHSSEHKFGAKAGLGLEFKLSEALAMRAEVERYRVNDAVGNRGDIDLWSLNLVYKLGRPTTAAPLPQPAPEPVAAAMPISETAPAAAVATPVSEKVSFAAEALFDFDRAVVKPDGKAALDGLLQQLRGMDTEVMITVGYTDSVGSADYNQRLSVQRAEAVKAYLVGRGVTSERVYTEGKGESQPVADNRSAAGRASNRRVTVEVVGTRHAAQ